MNKKGAINFEFILKHPSAILIGGGILLLLIGQKGTGWALIIIGIILHLFWLKRW